MFYLYSETDIPLRISYTKELLPACRYGPSTPDCKLAGGLDNWKYQCRQAWLPTPAVRRHLVNYSCEQTSDHSAAILKREIQ
jgi:hypothetical protein